MQMMDKNCEVDVSKIISSYTFQDGDPQVNQFLPYFLEIQSGTDGNKLLSYLEPLADVLRSTDVEEPEEAPPDPNDKKAAAAKPKEAPVQLFQEKQAVISAEQRYIDTLTPENVAIRHWTMLLLAGAIFDIENVHSMSITIQEMYYILEIVQRSLYAVSFSKNTKLYEKQFMTTLSFIAFMSRCMSVQLENKKLVCNEAVLRWEKEGVNKEVEEHASTDQKCPGALLDNYFYALSLISLAWPKVCENSGLLQGAGGPAPPAGKSGKGEAPAAVGGPTELLQTFFARRKLAAFIYNNILTISTVLGNVANLASESISRPKYTVAAKCIFTITKDVVTFVVKAIGTLRAVCNDLLDTEGGQPATSGFTKDLQVAFLFEKELQDPPKVFQIKDAALKQVKEASYKCFDSSRLIFEVLKCYCFVCINSLYLPAVPVDPKTGKPDPTKADPKADLLNVNLDRSAKELFIAYSCSPKVVPYRCHPVYVDNYAIIQLFRSFKVEKPYQQQVFTAQELLQLLNQQMQYYDSDLKPNLGNLEAFVPPAANGQFSLLSMAGFILKLIQAVTFLTTGGTDQKGPAALAAAVVAVGNPGSLRLTGTDSRLAAVQDSNNLGLLQLAKTCL